MALHSALTDLSTRIRNGQKARKLDIIVKKTRNGENILKALKEEGFIRDFLIHTNHIQVYLKYVDDKPCINTITPILENTNNKIVSVKKLIENRNLLQINNQGLGIFLLTTSKGIISDIKSIRNNLGGQIILKVL